MIFGSFPIDQAEGLLLARTLRLQGKIFSKGHCLSAQDVAFLAAQGIDEVSGARLDDNDIEESTAADQIANALAGAHVVIRRSKTGRSNLHATAAGLVVIAAEAVDRINVCSGEVAVSTLPPWSVARQGDIIATIKIIPFAVSRLIMEQCCAIAEAARVVAVAPFVPHRVALVVTALPHTKISLLEKAETISRRRIEALGSQLALVLRCRHDAAAVQAALTAACAGGCDLILVCGATVTVDVNDIVPAAVNAAGGEVEHFGMPVEPGNMLLLAHIGEVPIINLPGCARAPHENGFDWVLRRLLAKLSVDRRDLMLMGVGGLIRERFHPVKADFPHPKPCVAALVLAAGRSTRMGRNKLLMPIDGSPMVEHVTNAALNSKACHVVVVTGFEAELIEPLFIDRDAVVVYNPHFATGMASSLEVGLRSLPPEIDAVLVLLGDMPYVRAEHIDRLIDMHRAEPEAICVPHYRSRRGNPVLWPRRYFERMLRLAGDAGARGLLDEYAERVHLVEFESSAILHDIDTEEALAAPAPLS